MNKILYSNNEFWLLQDWPEDPRIIDNPHNIIGLNIPEQAQHIAAIEQSKSNKIKISNPELAEDACWRSDNRINDPIWSLYNWKTKMLKDGDTFDFPEGLRVEITERLSEGWVPSYNDPDNSGGHPNAEPETVVILSKEDNSAHSYTEGSEEPKDGPTAKEAEAFATTGEYHFKLIPKDFVDNPDFTTAIKELNRKMLDILYKQQEANEKEIAELREKVKQLDKYSFELLAYGDSVIARKNLQMARMSARKLIKGVEPKEEESQEELWNELADKVPLRMYGERRALMDILWLKQHFRIERIKTLEK